MAGETRPSNACRADTQKPFERVAGDPPRTKRRRCRRRRPKTPKNEATQKIPVDRLREAITPTKASRFLTARLRGAPPPLPRPPFRPLFRVVRTPLLSRVPQAPVWAELFWFGLARAAAAPPRERLVRDPM